MTQVIAKSKRGDRHEHNPFIGNTVANTKQGVKRISSKGGDQMMVVSQNTGEIIAPAGFWQAQEVDKTAFVKLYINGVKAFSDLTGAGTKMFELLYMEVQANISKDQLWLTFPSIDQRVNKISKAVFYRGMKELLEKDFIAESLTPGLYFLNPDYMWNGDRLAFVKEYRKTPDQATQAITKSQAQEIDTKTMDMFAGLN